MPPELAYPIDLGKSNLPIQSFDGSGNVIDFLDRFDLLANAKDWDADDKCKWLRLCLAGGPCIFYKKLRGDVKRDWDQLRVALVDEYNNAETRSLLLLKLSKIKQYPAETVQDFSSRIQLLAASALQGVPADVAENIMMTYFLEGLRFDLRKHVLPQAARDFNDACRIAKTVEANSATYGGNTEFFETRSQQDSRRMGQLSQQFSRLSFNGMQGANNFRKSSGNFVTMGNVLSPNRGFRSNRVNPKINAQKIHCFNCGQYGHTRRDCWSRVLGADPRISSACIGGIASEKEFDAVREEMNYFLAKHGQEQDDIIRNSGEIVSSNDNHLSVKSDYYDSSSEDGDISLCETIFHYTVETEGQERQAKNSDNREAVGNQHEDDPLKSAAVAVSKENCGHGKLHDECALERDVTFADTFLNKIIETEEVDNPINLSQNTEPLDTQEPEQKLMDDLKHSSNMQREINNDDNESTERREIEEEKNTVETTAGDAAIKTEMCTCYAEWICPYCVGTSANKNMQSYNNTEFRECTCRPIENCGGKPACYGTYYGESEVDSLDALSELFEENNTEKLSIWLENSTENCVTETDIMGLTEDIILYEEMIIEGNEYSMLSDKFLEDEFIDGNDGDKQVVLKEKDKMIKGSFTEEKYDTNLCSINCQETAVQTDWEDADITHNNLSLKRSGLISDVSNGNGKNVLFQGIVLVRVETVAIINYFYNGDRNWRRNFSKKSSYMMLLVAIIALLLRSFIFVGSVETNRKLVAYGCSRPQVAPVYITDEVEQCEISMGRNGKHVFESQLVLLYKI